MVQKFKLMYFNLRGRAELARLILASADQEYEDFRFEREQWPQHKANTPFGQAPVLEVIEDGKTVQIAQSLAIARYLARKFDLYGKNELETAEIDMFADQLTDMVNELFKVRNDSAEAVEKHKTEILNKNLTYFEDKLAKNASGFIVGHSLCWLDLYLNIVLDSLLDKKDNILANFPRIKENDQKVRALPKIADWIAKRPVTFM